MGYGECGDIRLFFCIAQKYSPIIIYCPFASAGLAPESNRGGGGDTDANGSGGEDEGRGEGRGSRPAGKERGEVVLARGGASSSRRRTFIERGR